MDWLSTSCTYRTTRSCFFSNLGRGDLDPVPSNLVPSSPFLIPREMGGGPHSRVPFSSTLGCSLQIYAGVLPLGHGIHYHRRPFVRILTCDVCHRISCGLPCGVITDMLAANTELG